MIADDINVSLLALTKSMDSNIFTLFSFKPRKSKQKEDPISHALLKRMSFPFQMQEEPEPPKIKRSLSGGTHCSCFDTEDNVLSILHKQNPNYHAFRPFIQHQNNNLVSLTDA
ncbi:hypothetical protein RMATCC62417_13430 [Rhizopus microsporus]|nr:hypothetical protein RMATCC62417_13430 [Rhizopus microsporus]